MTVRWQWNDNEMTMKWQWNEMTTRWDDNEMRWKKAKCDEKDKQH